MTLVCDKFVAFSPSGHLVVAGTQHNHIFVGPSDFGGITTSGPYPTKANAGELNKWICLSIHWNVHAGANKTNVLCNGNKLCGFTARTSSGYNQMIFGDLNPNGIAGLNCSIAFLHYTRKKLVLKQRLGYIIMCYVKIGITSTMIQLH